MRRFATAIAAALVLLVTALPAATTCCLGKPDSRMASMHASMPCCAERCAMSNPNGSRDHDVTLAPAPSPQPAAPTVAAIITAASPARVTGPVSATEHAANEFSSPPPFLVNAQFRI